LERAYFCAQADTGNRQLEELRRQIALTENNNLASMMQKASELISDLSEAKMRAGIATLQSLAEGRSTIAFASRNLLISFIQEKIADAPFGVIREAITAQNSVYERTGEVSPRWVTLDYLNGGGDFPILRGVEVVVIKNGMFELFDLEPAEGCRIVFDTCVLEICNIIGSRTSFKNCKIKQCFIDHFEIGKIKDNRFEYCDFSETNLVGKISNMPSLVEGKNYFVKGKPPQNAGSSVHWGSFLLEHDNSLEADDL
jgi:hypothetical protein